jgi:hypothetical protein
MGQSNLCEEQTQSSRTSMVVLQQEWNSHATSPPKKGCDEDKLNMLPFPPQHTHGIPIWFTLGLVTPGFGVSEPYPSILFIFSLSEDSVGFAQRCVYSHVVLLAHSMSRRHK